MRQADLSVAQLRLRKLAGTTGLEPAASAVTAYVPEVIT